MNQIPGKANQNFIRTIPLEHKLVYPSSLAMTLSAQSILDITIIISLFITMLLKVLSNPLKYLKTLLPGKEMMKIPHATQIISNRITLFYKYTSLFLSVGANTSIWAEYASSLILSRVYEKPNNFHKNSEYPLHFFNKGKLDPKLNTT